jgi:hypothetical protein
VDNDTILVTCYVDNDTILVTCYVDNDTILVTCYVDNDTILVTCHVDNDTILVTCHVDNDPILVTNKPSILSIQLENEKVPISSFSNHFFPILHVFKIESWHLFISQLHS